MIRNRIRWIVSSVVSLWVLNGSLALAQSHPVVPGFERLSDRAGRDDVQLGLLLLSELNCVSCHADASSSPRAKQAPKLDEVAQRVRPEYLSEFLLNPSASDPGTTMPHVLHGANEADRRQQVTALVHYLSAGGNVAEAAPVAAGVHRGRQLFHAIGCLACHESPEATEPPAATSIPLANLPAKYGVPGLAAFLENPLHVRPSGRMPRLNLTSDEARDLACFLLRDLKIPTSMTFEYYEGQWDQLPDFEKLAPKLTGGAAGFDVLVGAKEHFALRFHGKFRAEQNGQYRFFLASDDGSRLLIDGQEVLRNDGIHALTEKEAKVPLEAGEHDFVVEYFEGNGEEVLRVEFQGPKIKKQSLEFALVAPPQSDRAPPFAVDATLAEQGRQVFRTAGCAACHSAPGGEKVASAAPVGPALTALKNGGCLAENPAANVPRFGLAPKQRAALVAALGALREASSPLETVDARVHHTLATLNCYACHERGGVGGVEEVRQRHFRSDQPEMGDEGRIPPTLTGVGAKLKTKWLEQIFEKGPKDRPYMLTRMPTFGAANAKFLAADFAKLDPHAVPADSHLATLKLDEPIRKSKAIGRQLVGDRGMSCVKCHTWGNLKATGIQAIGLTTMTQRLNHDWFHAYLIDPQKYRPGTRMPAAWPNGQSPFARILDGDAGKQIESIWLYLNDGNDATMPAGVGSQPIELIAGEQPVIYRNFLEGVGPRGIAVGYPERVHLAFDAHECRLAILWQGAFLDASMHWSGRGQGFQRPLGDNVLQLPKGSPLATLETAETPWPTSAPHQASVDFGGYQLNPKGQPRFLYRWKSWKIEDALEPGTQPGVGHLLRTIRILPGDDGVAYWRVATGKSVETTEPHRFLVNQDWQLRVTGSAKPEIRTISGEQELLLRLDGMAGKPIELQFEYLW